MSNTVETTPGRRASLRFRIGMVLVMISLLTLCASPSIFFGPLIDFPCESGLGGGPAPTLTSRLVYCISWWPRNAPGGGGVAASGRSDIDEVSFTPEGIFGSRITVERKELTFVANGQSVIPREKFSRTYWNLSWSPWVILTATLTLENRGILKAPPNNQNWNDDTLYLSGEVREGWMFNPVGLGMLVTGVALIVAGRRSNGLVRPRLLSRKGRSSR